VARTVSVACCSMPTGKTCPTPTTVVPVRGSDVTLTLDMRLMQLVETAFEPYEAGAVVVVDVHDGGVLALFSAPGVDPGELSSVLSTERIEELRATDALVDRALGRAYRPGGTMKTLTVLAGLEAGLDPASTMECTGSYTVGRRGRPAQCFATHGETGARHAIVTSCRMLPFRIGLELGLDGLAEVTHDFGFGASTGIGLRGEVAGHVPTEASSTYLGPNVRAYALTIAVGQGELTVTPLQLAMAYAAIANGGSLWTPRIVSSVTTPEGYTIEHVGAQVHHQVSASPEHLAFLREALDAAVNDPMGTAYESRGEQPRVAGKTGHAYGARGRIEATWFAGFAPADDPQLAIVVLLEGDRHYEPARIAVEILHEHDLASSY
jgi:penicillin-binding protein 2